MNLVDAVERIEACDKDAYNVILKALYLQRQSSLRTLTNDLQEQEQLDAPASPIRDKNGRQIEVGHIIVNDVGIEAIMCYGYYTAIDYDGAYEGCGWYLRLAEEDDDGFLLLYQVTPVVRETSSYFMLLDKDEPKWQQAYLRTLQKIKERKNAECQHQDTLNAANVDN